MYEDAIKTTGNGERLELREITELLDESLASASGRVAAGGPAQTG